MRAVCLRLVALRIKADIFRSASRYPFIKNIPTRMKGQ
jgi:hypothetical protein